MRMRCQQGAPTRRSATTLIAVLTVLLVTVIALTGCEVRNPGGVAVSTSASSDPEPPFEGTRPAKVVFEDFLNTIDDIAKNSSGAFPEWSKEKATKYDFSTETCVASSGKKGYRYVAFGEGGAVKDSDAAIAVMKEHWESKGYSIGNIFTNMGGNVTGRQINATTPNGSKIQFTPAEEEGSTLDVKGECSLDPAMKNPTSRL